jgi:hypothetical protein
MSGRRLLVALFAGVLTIGVASPAHAQSKAAPSKGREAQVQPKQPGGKKAAPRKVVRLEEMRVEGRVQKPQAMFLMPRASVSSGEQDRSESFLPKAKDAVERDPF